MVLLLDNYDSFTYNIVQYLEKLGVKIVVRKSDAVTLQDISAMQPKAILLGPGPGTPDEAGITLACLTYFKQKLPIFGVCLGHQAIAQAFGADIIRAQHVMHGRTSQVYHRHQGVFRGLDNPTKVTRYHSLMVDQATLPECLEVTAWTTNNTFPTPSFYDLEQTTGHGQEIMGIRHKTYAIEGVQFHPESILSESGEQLFNNFLVQNRLV